MLDYILFKVGLLKTDDIVASFARTQKRLEMHAHRSAQRSNRHERRALRHSNKATAHQHEVERADRIARKVADLVA